MPHFQIVNGLVSTPQGLIKPGMVVEWSEEVAAAWYPEHKGWIKRVNDPNPKKPAPAPAPEPEPVRVPEPQPDPAEMSAYNEPTEPAPEPVEPVKLYEESQKRTRKPRKER